MAHGEQLERDRDALATTHARYRAVFDQAAVGIAFVSPAGVFLEVNDRLCAIARRARDELLKLDFAQITHPDDLATDNERVRGLLAGEYATYTLEKRYLKADGAPVWINLTVSLVRDAAGLPDFFVAVVEDISQRRLAEDALRESEQRFRKLTEQCPDAILILKDGVYVYANAAAVRIYGGSSVDDLIGLEGNRVLAPEYHEAARRRTTQLMAGETPPPMEVEIVRADGVRVPMEATIGLVEWAGGRALQLLTRDISIRRAAEATVIDSNRRAREQLEELEAIYETSPVGLAFLTPDLRFVRVNRRLAEMNGVAAADHIGRTIAEVAPAVADQAAEIRDRLIAGEPMVSHEITGETQAAPGVAGAWLEYWVPLKAADGTLRGFNVVVEDITERNLAEQRRKLLLDELNHRVRNTLAVVQSIARQTFANLTAPVAQRVAFEERLHALAAAHGVLTRENWRSADLAAVASAAVGSQSAGRLTLDGPPAPLSPELAVNLSLALHELATNASKYGALSTPEGRVEVVWTLDAARRLHLTWRERNGPLVAPPTRRGFGTRMLERAFTGGIQGRVEREFLPDGLVCRIEAQLRPAS